MADTEQTVEKKDEATPETAPAAETANAAPASAQPPEVAGEPPADPNLIGHLDPNEMAQIGGLRQQGTQITLEIGNIEVRKARLLGALEQAEKRAQAVMDGALKRMGVPDGEQVHISGDGSVRRMPAKGNVVPMPGPRPA